MKNIFSLKKSAIALSLLMTCGASAQVTFDKIMSSKGDNPTLPFTHRTVPAVGDFNNDDFMDITKRGVSNVHMMFEKNRKNVTYYYTPYGSLLIGIDAKSVDVRETENDIDVKVNYELEVNYEHMADCCITMNIKSKDAGDFRITESE